MGRYEELQEEDIVAGVEVMAWFGVPLFHWCTLTGHKYRHATGVLIVEVDDPLLGRRKAGVGFFRKIVTD